MVCLFLFWKQTAHCVSSIYCPNDPFCDLVVAEVNPESKAANCSSMISTSLPVSDTFLNACPDFPKWWAVIWKCKSDAVFPPAAWLSSWFHHSNSEANENKQVHSLKKISVTQFLIGVLMYIVLVTSSLPEINNLKEVISYGSQCQKFSSITVVEGVGDNSHKGSQEAEGNELAFSIIHCLLCRAPSCRTVWWSTLRAGSYLWIHPLLNHSLKT